jgi:hypothetical protein
MFGGRAAELPSAEELFTSEVEAALAALPTVTSVSRGPDFSLSVTTTGGQTPTMFLGNIFLETRDLGAAERRERIRRFVAVLQETPEDAPPWTAVGDRLVPVLRAATFDQRVFDDPTARPIRRRFVPFLVEGVGIDSENSFQFINQATVAGWNVGADAVFEAARANARRCFDGSDVERHHADGPAPLWHVARDDSYESSRLLVSGWLASFTGKVVGRPVAIAPSRSKLVVGGDGDERCLRQLIDSARREYEASPRSISPGLYTVDQAGAVVPLVLPPQHSLADEVALGHLTLAVSEYKTQQDDLQARLGEQVFVASCTGIRRNDGGVFSYTTWAKDVDALLPRAEQIAFGESAGADAAFWVPWDAALAIVGDCLCLEPGHDPPRWRTGRWPDPATIAKLKAAAIA